MLKQSSNSGASSSALCLWLWLSGRTTSPGLCRPGCSGGAGAGAVRCAAGETTQLLRTMHRDQQHEPLGERYPARIGAAGEEHRNCSEVAIFCKKRVACRHGSFQDLVAPAHSGQRAQWPIGTVSYEHGDLGHSGYPGMVTLWAQWLPEHSDLLGTVAHGHSSSLGREHGVSWDLVAPWGQ